MANPGDRRRFDRVASAFPLRFQQIPVGGAGYRDASVADVSQGGVRFRCLCVVRPKSSLIFELLMPEGPPVRSFGRAAWVRELPGGGGFEVGGTFEEQSTRARRLIARHLEREPAPALA